MPEAAADPTAAPVVRFKSGEYLFREGERHGSLFVIENGQVELVRSFDNATERLALLGPGDVVGEDGAFSRRAAGCSARAVTDTAVVRVAAPAFEDVLRVQPGVASHVITALGRRLLEARVACVIASADSEPAPAGAPVADAQVPAGSSGPAAARPAAVAARLVHEESGITFPLPPDAAAVIGRADPRTKFMPHVDLSQADTGRSLSRRHASISRVGTSFLLREEGNVANGTFVNGQRLQAGIPMAIKDGDEVSFGLVRTVFRTS